MPDQPVNEPNIFPGNWTVKTQQLLRTYEQSFVQDWNPVTLSWSSLDPSGLDLKERVAQAYWMAKLALFEKSGIGAFGTAMLKAAMYDMEDPTKKFLAAVTFDECRHDEVCRRACNKLCPNFPYKYNATTDFEKRALKNITALYENGRRYWNGFMKAWDKYPLELIFSSFFFAEIGAQLIFKTVSELSTINLYKEAFQNVTVDESRHLAGTLSLLDNLAKDFQSDEKLMITRQMKHGFIFLSPLLYKPMPVFWHLPKDFDEIDSEMEETARDSGLGVPTMEEKSKGWLKAIQRRKEQVEKLGIPIPAIHEIDLEGAEVDVRADEPVATPF
jgi:rubrerythrin